MLDLWIYAQAFDRRLSLMSYGVYKLVHGLSFFIHCPNLSWSDYWEITIHKSGRGQKNTGL
jgi:hypothetical protein